jgi:hypothetical protein
MTADELNSLTIKTLDTLGASLDAGHSDELTAFLSAIARFHRYSFHNICLIVAQCPTATQVAGFHTWKALHRFVRRGEKGIAICAPIIARRNERGSDEQRDVAGFRATYVFDLAQTDGELLPNVTTTSGDPGCALQRLRAAVVDAGIVFTYADSLDGALGRSLGGSIEVLANLAPATEFVVLAHEYAHELLHHADDRPASRDTRELEAEAVACVVSEAVGLRAIGAARDYIHLYRGDKERLCASLGRIQRTASAILMAMTADARPDVPA